MALILNRPDVPPAVVPELRPGETPRAPRVAVRLPVRCRLSEIDEWYSGETENISQSGIAFQTAQSDLDFAMAPMSEDGVRLEMVLEVPGLIAQAPKEAVLCRGVLVRVSRGLGLGMWTHVAVRVRGDYGVATAHSRVTH